MTPHEFVRNLYEPYKTRYGPTYLGEQAPQVFSPRLLNLIRADQDARLGEGKLDEDPICNCQDSDGFQLSNIQVSRLSPHQATARVTFAIGDERKFVILDLLRSNSSWRVAVIHNDSFPSVVSYLSHR